MKMDYLAGGTQAAVTPIGKVGYDSPFSGAPKRRVPGVREGITNNFSHSSNVVQLQKKSSIFEKMLGITPRSYTARVNRKKPRNEPKFTPAFNAIAGDKPIWSNVVYDGVLKLPPTYITPEKAGSLNRMISAVASVLPTESRIPSCDTGSNVELYSAYENEQSGMLSSRGLMESGYAYNPNRHPGYDRQYDYRYSECGVSDADFNSSGCSGVMDEEYLRQDCFSQDGHPNYEDYDAFATQMPPQIKPSYEWNPWQKKALCTSVSSAKLLGERWAENPAYIFQPDSLVNPLEPPSISSYHPGYNYSPNYTYHYNYYPVEEFMKKHEDDVSSSIGIPGSNKDCLNDIKPLSTSQNRLAPNSKIVAPKS